MRKQFTKTTKIGKITLIEENQKITNLILPSVNYTPNKNEVCESELLKEAFEQLFEYLDGKRQKFQLPLNPEGTDFQKKVWNELIQIPYGKTTTYKQIAALINNPNAQRAVGSANNKNPIPIFIPCHRVIGKNGNLTGYAGGFDLKNKLLQIEKIFKKV